MPLNRYTAHSCNDHAYARMISLSNLRVLDLCMFMLLTYLRPLPMRAQKKAKNKEKKEAEATSRLSTTDGGKLIIKARSIKDHLQGPKGYDVQGNTKFVFCLPAKNVEVLEGIG